MITKLLTKVIGSRNDRTLRRLRKIVKEINNYEPAFEALSDEELKAKTVEFRQRIEQGETLINCCQKLLPPCAKLLSVCSACAILMYS